MDDDRASGLPSPARRSWLDPSAGAVALFAASMAASFSAFDGGAHRGFFVPKLLLTYGTGVAALGILVTRRELRQPGRRVWIPAAVAFLAMALLALKAPAPDQAWVELSVLSCGAVVFYSVTQLTERERRLLSLVIVAVAALQLAIAVLQAVPLRALLSAELYPRPDRAAFGSVGNPEFLATLLGVAAALGLGLLPGAAPSTHRRRAAPIVVALLLGLLLTRNKGGLALVGAWFAWMALRRWPKARPLVMGFVLVLALGLVALLEPASVKGRALLWLASARMILDHPWLGVGAGQVQNVYLRAVHQLFLGHPRLAAYLGAHTAQVDDAHDVLLQGWASLGVTGLVSAAALLCISLGAARRPGAAGLALAWLSCKSLYTVVLGSLSGTILWALALGLVPWRWQVAPPTPRRRWLLALGVAVALAPAQLGVRLALADRAYQRGLLAQAKGDDAAALAEFEKAVHWQPSLAEAHLGVAYVHFGRGEREQMRRSLEAALRLTRTMDVLKISAHMLFYSHLYSEALPLYAFLHEVFPEHLTSMAKLALIRLEAGDEDGARAMARELLATRPRHSNFSDAKNREIARRILDAP